MLSETVVMTGRGVHSQARLARSARIRAGLGLWLVLTTAIAAAWWLMTLLPALPLRFTIGEAAACTAVCSVFAGVGAVGGVKGLTERFQRSLTLSSSQLIVSTSRCTRAYSTCDLEWAYRRLSRSAVMWIVARPLDCIVIYIADGTPSGTDVTCGIEPSDRRVWSSALRNFNVRRRTDRDSTWRNFRGELIGMAVGVFVAGFVSVVDFAIFGFRAVELSWYVVWYLVIGLVWGGAVFARWRRFTMTRCSRWAVLSLVVVAVLLGLLIGNPCGFWMTLLCGCVNGVWCFASVTALHRPERA